jgi:hypothetical protein
VTYGASLDNLIDLYPTNMLRLWKAKRTVGSGEILPQSFRLPRLFNFSTKLDCAKQTASSGSFLTERSEADMAESG